MHAYWLYAIRVLPDPDPAFTHPLFWKGSPAKLYPGGIEPAQAFMAELERMQVGWKDTLRADATTAPWIEPQHLLPHARLVQLCDGLSLALASNLIPSANPPSKGLGDDAFELHDVPRQGWSDRVTIRVTPHGNGRLELDPYPFDVDPLPVVLPARVAKLPADKPAHLQSWWNAAEPQRLHFTLCHAKS